MKFLRFLGGDDSPEARAAVQAEQEYTARSIAAIEAGQLPLRAQERLASQREGVGGRPALWTSDLSVNEYFSARALHLEPLGQVLGASIYHIAYNVLQSQQWGDGELTTYSQALYEARDRALHRMRQEATMLGAHGVVGVRLEQKAYEWGGHLLDFVAIGTAVRLPSAPPLPQPFLSDLSGQETLTLMHAGYVPVGLAMGCCAYYVATTWDEDYIMKGRWGWGGWANQEMNHFTEGIYRARHGAMRAIAANARDMHADGIVGSDVSLRTHEVGARRPNPYQTNEYGNPEYEGIEDHVFEFSAVGTAIVAISETHELPHATLTLDVGR